MTKVKEQVNTNESVIEEEEVIKCFNFKKVELNQDGLILEYQEDGETETINLFQFVAYNTIKEEDLEGLIVHLNSNETLNERYMTDSLIFLLIGVTVITERYLNNITDGDESEEIRKAIVKEIEAMSC